MTSVSDCFQSLRDHGRCALIPFITAGDPDLDTTARALQLFDHLGADLIELGIPYADSLADGPVIQAAATRALVNGIKIQNILGMVKQVSPEIKAPIILFTYYNPIFYHGVEAFLKRVKEAGVKGLIVPDLPLEEAHSLLKPAAAKGIEVTLLVTPTSPIERIQAIARQSQGFIYLVSVTGVTGMRSQVASKTEELITNLHSVTDKPIGVGFGISEVKHAVQMKNWGADGVIVGSAIVKRLSQGTPEEGLSSVEEFFRSLKEGIN